MVEQPFVSGLGFQLSRFLEVAQRLGVVVLNAECRHSTRLQTPESIESVF